MWRAVYQTPDGKVQWSVDVETWECPRWLITPESLEAVERYSRSRRTHEATGGVLYGADSSLWPARWVDTVALLSCEEERANAAWERARADWVRSQTRR